MGPTLQVNTGRQRRGDPSERRSRRWLRAALRAVLLAAGCAALLHVCYLIFAWQVLPDQLVASARDSGVELELDSLRSPHPGRIVLGAPILHAAHGWSLRAERLDATSRGYLPFGAPWQLDRCSVSGLFIMQDDASIGPIHAAIAAPLNAIPGHVEASASQARARAGEWDLTLALALRAKLEYWRDIGEFRVGQGSLSITTLEPELHAVVHLEAAAVSPGERLRASGRLTLTGDDAGLWLDMARADDTVRWLLSELEGQHFDLRATILVESGWLHAQDVRFEAGPTRARGALRSDGEALFGALLVRRGQATLGVSLSDAGVRAQLMPPPHWLSLELDRLALGQLSSQ